MMLKFCPTCGSPVDQKAQRCSDGHDLSMYFQPKGPASADGDTVGVRSAIAESGSVAIRVGGSVHGDVTVEMQTTTKENIKQITLGVMASSASKKREGAFFEDFVEVTNKEELYQTYEILISTEQKLSSPLISPMERFLFATVLREGGFPQEAIGLFKQGLEKFGGHAIVQQLVAQQMALAYAQVGDEAQAQAMRSWEKELESRAPANVNMGDNMFYLQILEAQARYGDQKERNHAFNTLPLVYRCVADFFQGNGQMIEAMRFYRRASILGWLPPSKGLRLMRLWDNADADRDHEMFHNALEGYRKAYEILPETTDQKVRLFLLAQIVLCHEALGEVEKAIELEKGRLQIAYALGLRTSIELGEECLKELEKLHVLGLPTSQDRRKVGNLYLKKHLASAIVEYSKLVLEEGVGRDRRIDCNDEIKKGRMV